jgi:hypothetical protein
VQKGDHGRGEKKGHLEVKKITVHYIYEYSKWNPQTLWERRDDRMDMGI